MQLHFLEKMPERVEDSGLGALSTTRGNLPLLAVSIRASITGFLSKTTLTQTFYNGYTEALEAVYLFPIPARAAVQRFIMRLPEREIVGVVKEREAAQEEYNAAIQAGHQAALAEEERSGLFTLRVGNIPPKTKVEIEMIIVGPLQLNEDEATFSFPLVVAPRYIPGRPLDGASVGEGAAVDTDAVPDASRISPPVLLPGFPSPVRLSFEATINPAGLSLRELSSSLHQMTMTQQDGSFSFAMQPGERLDRDIIVRFRFAADELQSHLLLSKDGGFFLTVIPPRTKVEPAPRDVVFLLDRSGSMNGWKFTAAKRAMSRMLDTLRGADRFAVCLFDTSIEAPSGLVYATDQRRFQAIEELAQAQVSGGTEMAPAFIYAANMLNDPTRERAIVFVTDGQVGNEDQLIQLITSRLGGVRVFSLGIDQAVNESFLRRVSQLSNGLYELVESEVRLDEVMNRLHQMLMPAAMTKLSIQNDTLQIEAESVTPSRLPDVFTGAPTQIFGRYSSPGALRLSGALSNAEPFQTKIEGIAITDGESIDTLWARSTLRELEESFIVGSADRAKLEEKMVAISTKFGVVCRFTALLAVDYDAVVNKGGHQQKIVQPVERPAGWSHTQSGGSFTEARGRSSVLFSLTNLQNLALGSSAAKPGKISLPAQPQLTRGHAQHSQLTKAGMIIGLPQYMSPEQAQGKRPDERSLVYTLGAILYEALCGVSPVKGESFMQMLMNVIQKPAARPSTHNAALAPFDALVLKALEKKPQDRYQSVEQLAKALAALSIEVGNETLSQWLNRELAQQKTIQMSALQGFTPTRAFGAYELGAALSKEDRGTFYLGRKTLSDGREQFVTIEEINEHQGADAQNQFMNEIKFVHTNSLAVLEAVRLSDESLFLVYEYEPGISLEELSEKEIPAPLVVEIFAAVCKVIAEAASIGVTPEEMNPEKIYVTFSGSVKVRRWGAALSAQWLAPRVHLTETTTAPQLPAPIAPPQTTERKQWWKFWK